MNEDGPEHWFRCILVVDNVAHYGVSAYCTTPDDGDRYTHLAWNEFDTLGVKSKFVAVERATF